MMFKKWFIIAILPIVVIANQIALPDGFGADFTQEITTPEKEKITYKGKIDFLAPSVFKWTYKIPTSKEVCTNGSELVVVDHDLEQVSFFVIDKGLNLPEVIANAKLVRPTVYTAKYQQKEYTLQVDAKGRLSRIAYYDELDNTVLIIFSQLKEAKPSYEVLQCSYPEHYDLVEE